jgi:hypothetical protein
MHGNDMDTQLRNRGGGAGERLRPRDGATHDVLPAATCAHATITVRQMHHHIPVPSTTRVSGSTVFASALQKQQTMSACIAKLQRLVQLQMLSHLCFIV